MNQEKIGKLIKKIRIENKLSQKEFASKYGVTFQAVSKWENGKNIPDISILKEICNDYNLKIDDFLDAKPKKLKKNIVVIITILLFLLLGILLCLIKYHDDFEFKTLIPACEDFDLYGSVAYNKNKSSIYINNITYCGDKILSKYKKISCTLFEKEGNTIKEINTYYYDNDKEIKIDEFLKDISFNIDDYESKCRSFKNGSLYLEIRAVTVDDKVDIHKIPLVLKDNSK